MFINVFFKDHVHHQDQNIAIDAEVEQERLAHASRDGQGLNIEINKNNFFVFRF